MASVTYGKSIMSSVIMAKILWQMKLSRGKGADPLPKKMGGFYGLTSHGFDQGERRKGTLSEKRR